MKELLETTPSLWQTVAQTQKPIALFGMGDGADKILNVLEAKGIRASAVFASDGYARKDVFRGFTVKDYSTTKAEWGDMLVLLAFGTQKQEVLDSISVIGKEQELYAPDVPVAGTALFTHAFVEKYLEEFEIVYGLLADDFSKKTFEHLIRFKLSGQPQWLAPVAIPREEIFSTLFPIGEDEIFVDAGAYNGDTVKEFVRLSRGRYQSIYALEPSLRNYRKLVNNTAHLESVTPLHLGAWSHKDTLFFQQTSGRGNALADGGAPNTPVDSIDRVLGGGPATYISYDVEGAEKEALEGSRYTLQTYQPKLWISAYHRSEDLFALPLQLREIYPKYQFYYRHNPYLPAWDIHLLALPAKE